MLAVAQAPPIAFSTVPQAPPITSSALASPILAVSKACGQFQANEPVRTESPRNQGEGNKHHKSYISLPVLKSRLRVPFFTPSLRQPEALKEPHVTVHSMFIQYAHGVSKLAQQAATVQVKVVLSDLQSVATCKKGPLITIPSTSRAEQYQVGFTFIVHRGQRSIDFHHKVLAPRKSKKEYFQPTGNYTVSAERQFSRAYPITDFIHNDANTHSPQNQPLPGRYTIKSCIRSRKPGTHRSYDLNNEMEELGEITWILQVS